MTQTPMQIPMYIDNESIISIDTIYCPYCNSVHYPTVCPSVKFVEYYPSGIIKKISFKERTDDKDQHFRK